MSWMRNPIVQWGRYAAKNKKFMFLFFVFSCFFFVGSFVMWVASLDVKILYYSSPPAMVSWCGALIDFRLFKKRRGIVLGRAMSGVSGMAHSRREPPHGMTPLQTHQEG